MELHEIGSVTYFTNIPPGESISSDEAVYVASQVAELFEAKLSQSPYRGELGIIRTEYEIGCVITVITIGATLAGLYHIIANYENFQSGLSKLAKDVNGIYVRIKKSIHKEGSTYVMKLNLPNKRVIEVVFKKAELQESPPIAPTKRPTRRRRK